MHCITISDVLLDHCIESLRLILAELAKRNIICARFHALRDASFAGKKSPASGRA